jgi:uncharacterized PurR-regulated membrane protein YhhQ (DUF165 family)
MSELVCLGTFFLMCFALIWCVYLGRTAIFVFTVGYILVSNVTVTKQVQFLGITTSLAIFIFPVTYLANDILTEYWGRRDAMKLVISNLTAQVAFMTYSMAAIWTPASSTDTASPEIASLFTVTPRVTLAAIISAVGGVICVAVFSGGGVKAAAPLTEISFASASTERPDSTTSVASSTRRHYWRGHANISP